MANFQQIMQDEIRRLARKEMKPVVEMLSGKLVDLRKSVLELQKQLKALQANQPGWAAKSAAAAAGESACNNDGERAVRITPERIITLRNKLGLNQVQFALLLDVSPLSLRQWESGKTKPRIAQKRRIAALRDLGKRELLKRMAELNIQPGKRQKRANKAESAAEPAQN